MANLCLVATGGRHLDTLDIAGHLVAVQFLGVSECMGGQSDYELVGGVGSAGLGRNPEAAGISAVLDVGCVGGIGIFANYFLDQS